MPLPKLIGLTGRKGSGKSTLAEKLNYIGYTRFSFAEPIRQMIGTLMRYQGATEKEISHYLTNGKEEPNPYLCGETTRWALQSLGTEWGRKLINENLWVEAWRGAATEKDGLLSPSHVVIDDVRFPNEVDIIHARNGKVIRIFRPTLEGHIDHESESYFDSLKVDIDIINNGPPENMLNGLKLFTE
jgi:energy-coupling factor transporter ATP-binding protein EcfA2